MALIFILLTQLINQTPFNLDFEVDHGRRLLPKLGPGKTRFAKPSRVLRQLRHYGRDWKIRVMIDGKFTGIELRPQLILEYVRVVFSVDGDGDGDVLCVDGVRENRGNDFLLRHRYFGCMRNFYWNSRLLESIARSDSKLATKLRNMEGHCCYLAPFVDINLEERYPPPEKESPKKEHNPPIVPKITKPPSVEQERPRGDPRPLDPSVDSEKLVRSRDPQPLRSPMETEENGIKRPRPNGTLPSQARVRDDPRPLNRPMDSEKQMRPRDEPRPLEPQTGEIGAKSLRPNGTATAQQTRSSPRDEESLTNVVDKDSFVHGLIIVFSFVVFILLKFLF